MSCYEWERGSIVIPSKEWARFRSGLLKAWNEHQVRRLEDARDAHAIMLQAGKGKRGEGRVRAMDDALRRLCGCGGHDESWGNNRYKSLSQLLYAGGKLQYPRKKDLSMKLISASKDTTIHARLDGTEAEVSFDNAKRTVHWYVSENNHAREHAHAHWFAKRLFAALNRIRWTRGSGGKIVGNDEYNRDSSYEGGGGNYVTMEFGPKQKGTR